MEAWTRMTCDDLKGVLLTVRGWVPEGFDSNSCGWQRGTWLRYEPVAHQAQLVLDWGLAGDPSIERAWPVADETAQELAERAEAGEGDEVLDYFASLMPEMRIEALTDILVENMLDETFPTAEFSEVLANHPRWTPAR